MAAGVLALCFFAGATFPCLAFGLWVAGFAALCAAGFTGLFAASLAIVALVACIAASFLGTLISGGVASDAANEAEAKLAARAKAKKVLIDFIVTPIELLPVLLCADDLALTARGTPRAHRIPDSKKPRRFAEAKCLILLVVMPRIELGTYGL